MTNLLDGEIYQVPGKAHMIKNAFGSYTCSCVAWKFQSQHSGSNRTCKHIVELRGGADEVSRVGYDAMPTAWKKKNPQAGSAPATVSKRNATTQPVIPAVTASGRKSTSKAAVAASKTPVLLAQKWTADVNPAGMLMSEKLDGIRAWWDGTDFFSRDGNLFYAPAAFKVGMPSYPLDGELYLGRGQFQETMSIVRTQNRETYNRWKNLFYMVFDIPENPEVFTERYKAMQKLCITVKHTKVVDHWECKGIDHLKQELTRVEGLGGEGMMLRDPDSHYQAGRNTTLLKVKSFFDTECEIIGHYPGKGKFKGMNGGYECIQHTTMNLEVGGKKCTISKGVKFKVGTGLTDKMRREPEPVGEIITYRFVELTKDGIPRHPAFVAVRNYE